jgi:hypothetical protein
MRIILAAALVMACGATRADQVNDGFATRLFLEDLTPPDHAFCPSGQHTYTLDEIDRMRRVIAFTADGADLMHPLPAAMVEDQLRTYMSAGIPPEDLERKAEGK